mgnify:FL=1
MSRQWGKTHANASHDFLSLSDLEYPLMEIHVLEKFIPIID